MLAILVLVYELAVGSGRFGIRLVRGVGARGGVVGAGADLEAVADERDVFGVRCRERCGLTV